VTLTAIGSKRKIDLRQTGVLTLLVCHGRETAEQAARLHTAVRQRYPLASTLLAASLVDLKIVPRMFRGVAEAALRQVHQQAVASLEEGMLPEEYIVILPDWDGGATAALGFRNTPNNAGVILLDGEGNLLEVYQGADLAETTLRLLGKYLE
jgi:hypothetical protein